jgi:hypothetical protein
MRRYVSRCGLVLLTSLLTAAPSCVESEPLEAGPVPKVDPQAERDAIERLNTTEEGKKIEGQLYKLDCSGGLPSITADEWPFSVFSRPDGRGGTKVDRIACKTNVEFIFEPPTMYVFCPVPGSPPSKP